MDFKKRASGAAQQWLEPPIGEALLQQETRLVEDAFDGLFGELCVQLGMWGCSRNFLRFARTQRSISISDVETTGGAQKPGAISQLSQLPVASNSVDIMFLPHTFDYSNERSHAILRETERVLTPHGHIVVLGFKPGGIWGLRRLIPGAELPPGAENLVSDRRLSDWLQLLDMRIVGVTRYFFRWPVQGAHRISAVNWEHLGRRFWPELSACYMLIAQKRVVTITPIKKPWRSRPKVVGGIAKPSTRIFRPRFD